MKRIRELRKRKGLTQQGFAMVINVSQAMVSKYERGEIAPDLQTLKNIADYFNVSTDYLLEISNSKLNVSSSDLTDAEKELLHSFKRLDRTQKEKVQAYIRGLLQE